MALGAAAEESDWAAGTGGPLLAPRRPDATGRRKKRIINALLLGGGVAVAALLVWGATWLVGAMFSGNSSAFSDGCWRTLRSEEHNCSALFPGEASLMSERESLMKRVAVWGLQTDTCEFSLWSISDPGASFFRGEQETADWLRTYACNKLKMLRKDIRVDKPITLEGGHSGVDIRCDNQNPDDRIQSVYYRLYDVAGQIYCLSVRTTVAGRDDPGVAKFLDSFTLIEPVPR